MKNVYKPNIFLSAQSMASSFVTNAIDVLQQDMMCIQANYSGAPVGSFSVEGSADDGSNYATIPVYINGTLTSSIAVPANTSPILIECDSTAISKFRLRYTAVSGSGSVTIYTSSKRLGD